MWSSPMPGIQAFFDPATSTASFLVWDKATKAAAVIDAPLDFDAATGKLSSASADAMLAKAEELGLRITWALETHAHADPLSAAHYIREKTGARIGIGARITEVQGTFRPMFGTDGREADASVFDALFADGETFRIGELEARVMHTPGHTPACVTYLIGDAAFVGDTLFMPDYGTARADFPGGSARVLYASIRRLLDLPPETRIFVCHDYKADGRDYFAWETTVDAQRKGNIHIRDGISEEEFVAMRTQRDASLAAPTLLLPSIQVNIRGGKWPQPESNGQHYLKIPI